MIQKEIEIETMSIDDYAEIMGLWQRIKGFHIREVDDDYIHIKKFLERNAGLSVVAKNNHHIVGTILSGHDGRQASLYHVCVDQNYRGCNIAGKMVKAAVERLQAEDLSKITLIAYKKNLTGNLFWNNQNWTQNTEINTYELILNKKNISKIVV